MATVIDRFQIRATFCLISVNDFQKEISDRWGAKRGADPFNQPYLFGLIALLKALAEDASERGEAEQMEVMFDEQKYLSRYAKDSYRQVREFFDPSIHCLLPSEPWFRDDRTFLPLQAADLVAGNMRLAAEGEPLSGSIGTICPSLDISEHSKSFDKAALQYSSRAIWTLLRSIRENRPYRDVWKDEP